MFDQFGRDPDPFAGHGRLRRDVTVPLSSMASLNDIEHARGLLAVHQPRAVLRRICSGCGEPWPCVDARYGWAVTGLTPEAGHPGRPGTDNPPGM
jgi:hypothetical protein